MHPSSLENMRKARRVIEGVLPRPLSVIEIGGRSLGEQDRSYRSIWADASYLVADVIAGPGVDVVMPGEYTLPATSGGVHLVVSGQTLEHVRNPFRLVEEMVRVLAPGGHVILIAPSAGPAHDVIDCWRFQRDAFRAIAAEVGLDVVADWIDTGDSGGGRGPKWQDHTFVGRKP